MDSFQTVLISILSSSSILGIALKAYSSRLDQRVKAEALERAEELKRQDALDRERRDTAAAYIGYMQTQVQESNRVATAMVATMAEMTKSLDGITRTQAEMLAELQELKTTHTCRAPKG